MTEAFSFLDPIRAVPGVRAAWIGRIPRVPLDVDRELAMARLQPYHEQAVIDFAGGADSWWRAEQVHGNHVEIVSNIPAIKTPHCSRVVPAADGLLTLEPGVVLAIFVADCGPIWLADRVTGAIGLLHSGKKGTESNILAKALDKMATTFKTRPEDVTAVLGPCIRPPDYETDFAAEIGRQASRAGIGHYHDCGLNTASDLSSFYSYRREQGKTGRMMALITRDR